MKRRKFLGLLTGLVALPLFSKYAEANKDVMGDYSRSKPTAKGGVLKFNYVEMPNVWEGDLKRLTISGLTNCTDICIVSRDKNDVVISRVDCDSHHIAAAQISLLLDSNVARCNIIYSTDGYVSTQQIDILISVYRFQHVDIESAIGMNSDERTILAMTHTKVH